MPCGFVHDLAVRKECMLRPLPIYALDVMSLYEQSKGTPTREMMRGTRVLFIVSRDRPDRYESLVHAFSGDADVKVIFDRRRVDRRQQHRPPRAERRRRDRRCDVRASALRSMGWVRVDC